MARVIWQRASFQYEIQVKVEGEADWNTLEGFETEHEAVSVAKELTYHHAVRVVDTWAEGDLDD